MNIRIYTDLEAPDFVTMDLTSLIHAYEYAIKEENIDMSNLLMSLFSHNVEQIRFSKKDPIYAFLKENPKVKEDEITWSMVKEAYLIARLQNNTSILKILGTILGHWEQYRKEQKESEGLLKEVLQLSEETKNYILKYHDSDLYEEQMRSKDLPKQNYQKEITSRSIVEIGNYKKTYKKAS